MAMLANKGVIVTGGLGALGRVVASELAAQGARVAVLDCSARSDAACRAEVVFDGVDLCNASATAKAIESIAAQLGGIFGLVNIAGGFRYEPILEGNLDTWDLMYETNLRSCAAACLAVLPYLRSNGSGRIVNIGAAGARATCGLGAYAASKAGVARLTESLSDELKDQSITVNAVLPSVIDTPANRLQMSGADFTRWVSPTSVAHLVAFLLSEQSIDITGALIPIVGRM